MLGQRSAIHNARGRHGNFIAINIGVEPIGRRTRGRSKKLFEAVIQRPAFDGACVIHPLHSRQPVLVNGFALLVKGRKADVPFAEHGRGVALLFQETGQCKAAGINQARPTHAGKHSAIIQPERHTAGEHAVACGCTNCRWTVSVGKPNTLLRQLIQMWRGHLGLRVVTADIAIAEVVSKDEKNVWSICSKC